MAITLQGNGTSTFSNNITSSTGDLTLGDGNLVVANGHGIDFSASEGSNATGSTFTDYEEGSWTPSFVYGGTSSVKASRYMRIGNKVTAYLYVNAISGIPNNTQEFRIEGLPYVSVNTTDLYSFGSNAIGYVGTADVNFSTYRGFVARGATNIYFHEIGQDPIRQNQHVHATLNGQSLLMTVDYWAA